MKRWMIVKVISSENDRHPALEREVPVIFKERKRAESMCRTLNRDKPAELKGYIVEERIVERDGV